MKRKKINAYAILKAMGACKSALDFVRGKDAQEAWQKCPDSGWLVWLVDQLGLDYVYDVRGVAHRSWLNQRIADGFAITKISFAKANEAGADAVRRVVPWPIVKKTLLKKGVYK